MRARTPPATAPALAAGPLGDDLWLRLAEPDDRDILFGWYTEAYRRHIDRLWGWHTGAQRRDFGKLFSALCPLVVVRDGEAIGYIQALRRVDALHLVNIVIRPAARSHGVGAALIHALQSRAARLGIAVTLKVFHGNRRAMTFYRRHGFRRVGAAPAHDLMRWTAPDDTRASGCGFSAWTAGYGAP